jgi:hypothetical protein
MSPRKRIHARLHDSPKTTISQQSLNLCTMHTARIQLLLITLLATACSQTTPPPATPITLEGIGPIRFDTSHPIDAGPEFTLSADYLELENGDSVYQYHYKQGASASITAETSAPGQAIYEISTHSEAYITTYQARPGMLLARLHACPLDFEMLDGDGGAYHAYERQSQTLLSFDGFLEMYDLDTCKPMKIKALLAAHPANALRRIQSITVQALPLPPLRCGS